MFGRNKDKLADEAAATAEADRLCSLSVADLAVEIMPAFGPDGPRPGGEKGLNTLQVVGYPMRSYPHAARYARQLDGPVREAVQLLESAGLVLSKVYEAGGGGRLFVTRRGTEVLASGAIRECLAEQRPAG